ncbi:MAG: hypothetical protein V1925_04560 [Candidatus Omnitrophota bacterium]
MKEKLRRRNLDLPVHFLVTAIACLLIYLKTAKPAYIFIFVLGAIFIDLDHFIDYFLYFGTKFRMKDFMGSTYLDSGKVYLFFHSWELVLTAFILSVIFKSTGLFIFFLGVLSHLVIDNVQRKNPLIYFIIYRIMMSFDRKILLPDMGRPFRKKSQLSR